MVDTKVAVSQSYMRGACDAHVHIVGRHALYPMTLPPGTEPPPVADLDEYMTSARGLGFERVVFNQPSFYGGDNSCQLDAVAALGDQARTIVVVPDEASDGDLDALSARGAVGIRIATSLRQAPDARIAQAVSARLSRWSSRLAGSPFCLEVLAPAWLTDELMPTLGDLRTNYILCHMGMYPAARGVGQTGFRNLLRLAETGFAWIKLTAAYRMSTDPAYSDTDAMARALGRTALDRLLWGSDHPHVWPPRRSSDAAMFDLFTRWFPDHADRSHILVHNPERLFGFARIEPDRSHVATLVG